MKCPYCGREVVPKGKVCPKCFAEIVKDKAETKLSINKEEK